MFKKNSKEWLSIGIAFEIKRKVVSKSLEAWKQTVGRGTMRQRNEKQNNNRRLAFSFYLQKPNYTIFI